LIFKNTKQEAERSETMLEQSDDYPKGEITNRVKTGGVCFKNTLKGQFLSLLKINYIHWDILFLPKLGNNVKHLGQITPLWLFFSPDEWHIHCIGNNNRKGKLCWNHKYTNSEHQTLGIALSRFRVTNYQARLDQ